MARVFVDLGIQKVRLTGGEPLLRRGLIELISELAKLRTPPDNGSLDIAVTTNGHILESQADELKAAGFTRLTVSMDAVDSDIGTTDLDIVVGVTVTTEEEELYRTLQNNLKDAAFAPAIDPETKQEQTFRWTRDVDGIGVFLEFFCPVGDGPAGRALRNPGKQIGSKISAMRMPGAELAALDHFVVVLRGETLDHGGIQEGVEARVANLLPFLVLKSFAIEERDKDKDSYDIVWILNAFAGGPEGAVAAMAKSPVLERSEVVTAIECLRKNFQSIDHRGPSQYARFESTEDTDEERTVLRRYAYGTMQEFFRHWPTLEAATK